MVPMAQAPAEMYFSKVSRQVELTGKRRLSLPKGAVLVTNSYFNCFYLDYWRRHSVIENLGLWCQARGSVRVRVIGHMTDGRTHVVAQWEDPVPGTDVRWLWSRSADTGPAQIGRLHLEVEALSDTVIERLDFVTDLAPMHDVRIEIGLCTFEREALLEKTIAGLQRLVQTAPAVGRVYVVNQGRRFTRPILCKSLKDQVFSVIEQANLGGCGGFTRTMIEALDSKDKPTHLLLMDDDIVLDPHVVTRAVDFMRYARRECALGGQAIELESGRELHEAGGRLGPNWSVESIGKDSDLGEEHALGLWNRAYDIDFNAWWFCLLPMAVVDRIGLPAPMFLRGDDIEYGWRMKEAGVPTIGLAGLGVWHSSFRYKHAGLLQYYDLRNILISASAHPGMSRMPDTLYVFGAVLFYLLVHRYRAAFATIMAIQDFLDGPDVALGPDSCNRHDALRAQIATLQEPEVLESVDHKGLKAAPTGGHATPMVWQALIYVALLVRILLWPTARQPDLLVRGTPLPENTLGKSYLLATEPTARRCLVLRPSRKMLLGMTWTAARLGVRYALGRRAAAARWVAQMNDLCSRERWAREFARKRSG